MTRLSVTGRFQLLWAGLAGSVVGAVALVGPRTGQASVVGAVALVGPRTGRTSCRPSWLVVCQSARCLLLFASLHQFLQTAVATAITGDDSFNP